MKVKGISLKGGVSTGRLLALLGLALLASVLAMGVSFYLNAQKEAQDVEYVDRAGSQQVLSQEIAKFATQAARGDLDAFPKLSQVRDQFNEGIRWQSARTPPEASAALERMNESWEAYRRNVDVMLENRDVVTTMREHIQNINEQIPNLLALSDEVVATMTEQGAEPDQIYIATRQLMLTQRIHSNVNRILEGGEEAVTAADRFGRDAALFGRVITDMLRGNRNMGIRRITDPASREKLEQVQEQFRALREQVGGILERSPEMFEVSNAAEEVLAQSDGVLTDVQQLGEAYANAIKLRYEAVLVYAFAALTIVLLVLMGILYWRDSRKRLKEIEQQRSAIAQTNAQNQEAILRLLDEMGDLADGDLTVSATVTEDITGAIADSINYAIDALRSLVSAINDTTEQVSSAAQQSQATAMHLAEASDHQAQQITGASTAINEMAVSIEGVSNNAAELADEAQRAVQIAGKGSDAVQRTIHGMDTIREQIQETSKRIKRLGESSQEIGDIVELINDIAEQTNILALNAAIQAAMAGEAGRGFAVVADEVQRLAERSGDATRQIDALVKAIQSDTNEAVASMEQSTSGVVHGAKLAQDAGTALEEIESVSNHLAELIAHISNAAKQQATAATNISDTMNVIQEITTQTSAGTNETAASIGNLAELANELRHSVAGFRLPQQ
ncbi:methyl-accepting chemotaxis protein [Thiohalophilus thiocyanatoxydans]|uniref:Twitching motility protein PilJ n=1 Tax=Thiohalophilus thiocyanatoxydans TaxID=381308 RepID=A0A4R8J2T6_9GAMM|nr:methyl-accepting chemotaxis protein [Thiohalophilus thiocyanatoxydans]TDY04173.1 twitching motility protein PilJ [Thiohalophilus thiocyanatoxydans]